MTGNTRKISLNTKSSDRAEVVSERPERTPLRESYRNILTVDNKDPNYEYRWVLDSYAKHDEDSGNFYPGQRISKFENAGWEFVLSGEVSVGDSYVYKTNNTGSIVRVPAGQGEYHYLMKIKKEWYKEDQDLKNKQIDDIEKQMKGPKTEMGQYGAVSIDFDIDR